MHKIYLCALLALALCLALPVSSRAESAEHPERPELTEEEYLPTDITNLFLLDAEAGSIKNTLYLRELTSAANFRSLAERSTGVIRQGETIKAFVDNRKLNAPEVYFMNANYCPQPGCRRPPPEASSHFSFAKTVLKGLDGLTESAYMATAYYTKTIAERKFFDARVQRFTLMVNGVDKEFYGIRFIERDLIQEEMIQYVVAAIMKKLRIQGQALAFLANSDTHSVQKIEPWLQSQGIATFTMEEILSGVKYIGLNPGTALGFLRFDPKDEENLEPYEIPVFTTLPLDLSVVAGTITTEFQDVGSHVNLKAKERGTPNMVLRDPEGIARLRALEGRPVKLTVDFDNYRIEEISEAAVYADYKKKIDRPWQRVSYVADSRLLDFDEMCPANQPAACLAKSSSYGGKSSGLGFLANPKVAGEGSDLAKSLGGSRLSPMGFGVPISFYFEFLQAALAKDPVLKGKFDLLIDSELGTDGAQPIPSAEKKALLIEIKAGLLQSEIPEELYRKVYAQMLALKKKVDTSTGEDLNKLKIRSSGNAEDIQGFNGAGLHDSYSAKIKASKESDFSFKDCKFVLGTDDDTGLTEEDVEPKSLACAMKATYASLWNFRALRERSFKRFDHRSAGMGLSIQTSYKFRKQHVITSNSVLITRVVGTESVYGQQLSTQVGNGLVTNPLPGTRAELLVLGFDVTGQNLGISTLQFAKPQVDGPVRTERILPEEQIRKLSKIAREVEIQYCEAKGREVYFPQGKSCRNVVNSARKPMALDMEFKEYSSGEILIKQVRLFTGR